jgi:hypothetical protein
MSAKSSLGIAVRLRSEVESDVFALQEASLSPLDPFNQHEIRTPVSEH